MSEPLLYDTLLEGDCIEVLRQLPDNSIDLIFADPPYNLQLSQELYRPNQTLVDVVDDAWDQFANFKEYDGFTRRWLSACRRVLKPSGTLWVSGTQHVIFSVGYALQELGFHLLNTVTWYKPNASPNLACRFFTHSTEILLWAAPMRTKPLAHRFNYRDMKAQNGGKQMRDLWAICEQPRPGGGDEEDAGVVGGGDGVREGRAGHGIVPHQPGYRPRRPVPRPGRPACDRRDRHGRSRTPPSSPATPRRCPSG